MRTGTASCLALLLLAAPATAAPAGAPGPWWSIGVVTGTTRFDTHLADYQWDLAPRASWGATAEVGIGPAGLALRAWSAPSTQALGAAVAPTAAGVRVDTYDLAGEVAVARAMSFTLLARASAGRVAIAYSPDRVLVDTGAGSTSVSLSPVDTWTWSGGAALSHPLPHGLRVTLAAERSAFAFDTAHRAGAAVVLARESFDNWNGRLELSRVFRLR